MRYRCARTKTTSAAGSRNTCAVYQRNSVSAPRSTPPRMSAATCSPKKRSAARDVDGDGRRPVGLLIPRQQVARQRKSQDEEQQDDARHPRDLARLLVRPEEDDAQHVNHGGDHDEARAEEVKSPDEPSERQPVGDEADAVVCELRRRHVVHRQDDAGHELQDEEEEEDAAGDEPPADARRQRLVEEM